MKKKALSFLLGLIILMTGCGRELPEKDLAIEEDTIRVAAVGDSITAEYTPDAGYPEKLDEMLGEKYTVINFGESNYSVQSSSDFPYEMTDSFQKSLDIEPDIVILMLGTNDTKEINWEGAEQFKKEYIKLLENYLQLEDTPRIILVSPPTVFAETTFRGSINSEHIPAIRDVVAEVAAEYDLEYIDMTSETKNHPQWFFDGIHPTPEGAEQMAEKIYNQI